MMSCASWLIDHLQQEPNAIRHYSFVDGELIYKGRLVVWSKLPICIDIMTEFHASSTAGHSGAHKTYKWAA